MQKREQRNILIVILDQFRYDYVNLLKKSREYLNYVHLCDTNSIPTMTETMHANISTGEYPSIHGIISDTYLEVNQKKQTVNFQHLHKQFLNLISQGRINLISKYAYENGYDVGCIGGKLATVNLLAKPQNSVIRIWRDSETEEAFVQPHPQYYRLRSLINNHLIQQKLRRFPEKNIEDPAYDKWIAYLSMLTFTNYFQNKNGWLIIITFPAMDHIGHTYGPGSSECLKAIRTLDDILVKLYSTTKSHQPIIMVIGDHGCRNIKTAIMLDNENHPTKFIIYTKGKKEFIFKDELYIDSSKQKIIDHIKLDGGMIRIWTKNKKQVDNLHEWLSSPEFLGNYIYKRSGNEQNGLRQIIENSIHKNFGDLFILANKEVAFLRKKWCLGFEKIIKKEALYISSEIPLGEHGSIWEDDRYIPLLSSHKIFEKQQDIENIEISRIVKKFI